MNHVVTENFGLSGALTRPPPPPPPPESFSEAGQTRSSGVLDKNPGAA